jgi:hypothetical protein
MARQAIFFLSFCHIASIGQSQICYARISQLKAQIEILKIWETTYDTPQ